MAITFPYADTMIQYLKGKFQDTQDRKLIKDLAGYVRKAYPDPSASTYDYYVATCNELGVAL